MSGKLLLLSSFILTVTAIAYLLFLVYALNQMKLARADGMAKVDALLDQMKPEHDG